MAQFEEYFQWSDSDRDGRISGLEAVGFFQGSKMSTSICSGIKFVHKYLLREELLPMADIVTPNLREASALLGGLTLETVADMRSQ